MNGDILCGSGAPRRIQIENFSSFAFKQLEAAPPWVRGRCFNPGCSQDFVPQREWQIYCGKQCERVGSAEMRSWGHRMAMPLLIHRAGKYEQNNGDIRDLNRAARRYLTYAQSAWLEDRMSRKAKARVK